MTVGTDFRGFTTHVVSGSVWGAVMLSLMQMRWPSSSMGEAQPPGDLRRGDRLRPVHQGNPRSPGAVQRRRAGVATKWPPPIGPNLFVTGRIAICRRPAQPAGRQESSGDKGLHRPPTMAVADGSMTGLIEVRPCVRQVQYTVEGVRDLDD